MLLLLLLLFSNVIQELIETERIYTLELKTVLDVSSEAAKRNKYIKWFKLKIDFFFSAGWVSFSIVS